MAVKFHVSIWPTPIDSGRDHNTLLHKILLTEVDFPVYSDYLKVLIKLY